MKTKLFAMTATILAGAALTSAVFAAKPVPAPSVPEGLIVDSTGKTVGRAVMSLSGTPYTLAHAAVLMSVNGQSIAFPLAAENPAVSTGLKWAATGLSYATSNCMGQAYMGAGAGVLGSIRAVTITTEGNVSIGHVAIAGPAMSIQLLSSRNASGVCSYHGDAVGLSIAKPIEFTVPLDERGIGPFYFK